MSVIAAKVYSDKICIASDSIVIKDDLKRTYTKLQKIGETICGGCGCAEELCLFFEFVKTHKLNTSSIEEVIKYISHFLTYIKELADYDKIENCYLIIQDNKLFEIEGFFVQEITDYTAIGAGEAYALTALCCDKTPAEAIKITCKFCTTVSEPVVEYVYIKD